MKLTTAIITDTLIERELGKWRFETMDMIHVHNATENFLATAFKDIQKISAKSKTRGVVCNFSIVEKLELPPFLENNRNFVIRLWEGMGRIMVHVGTTEDGIKESYSGNTDEKFVSMVGPDEGNQQPGMQGINWDTDVAVFVLWYITDRWWDLKTKFVSTKNLSIA